MPKLATSLLFYFPDRVMELTNAPKIEIGVFLFI